MIIAGYPGIGKSAYARKENGYIDLESSYMHGETKEPDWAERYISLAEDLDCQGYNVFVSTHPEVIRALEKRKYGVIIYPAKELRPLWIQRLRERYMKTKLPKDRAAYRRAAICYLHDIEAIENATIPKTKIHRIAYKLDDILDNIRLVYGP